MKNEILPISEPNLSVAWAKAFLRVRKSSHRQVHPLIVSVDWTAPTLDLEDTTIRSLLESTLQKASMPTPATVANTIFPQSLWNPKKPRGLLYKRYMEGAYPRLKFCSANNKGTYFQRMVSFDDSPHEPVNQLEQIISTYVNGNHRHSALQLSIFDPRKDHNNQPYLGFPCLHQVCLTPHGPNGVDGLSITGFYATQHLLPKAYGNYLGLFRLGQFIAHEMKLKFIGMTCIASFTSIGGEAKINAGLVSKLENDLQTYLDKKSPQSGTE
jgi:hypothetical protein